MERLPKWAHIAEITGAVAVVVSLLYVGYQVRENTTAMQSQTEINLFSLSTELHAWYRDPVFVDLVARANADFDALSVAERMQLERFVMSGMDLWAYALKSFRRGTIDEEEWLAWNGFFSGEFESDPWRRIYAQYRHGYADSFRQHVDSLVD